MISDNFPGFPRIYTTQSLNFFCFDLHISAKSGKSNKKMSLISNIKTSDCLLIFVFFLVLTCFAQKIVLFWSSKQKQLGMGEKQKSTNKRASSLGLMGTLKCMCSYLTRDIRANQLEHTVLRVLIEDNMEMTHIY